MTDHILSNSFQRARGVIGRYPEPGDRYILEYPDIRDRGVHMLGVHKPLQVTFYANGEKTHEEVLDPWTGRASARADTIVEQRPTSYRDTR